ncbi:hypothetical protein ACWOCD_07625 [Enterococcus silesiacus]|uniref:hypothetical protein n=1 Tax=Enterococcus silesiacus TaxID=332949 RepID=UPI0011148B4B|nr:hypothetical protein [Enterococcus silesiacus]
MNKKWLVVLGLVSIFCFTQQAEAETTLDTSQDASASQVAEPTNLLIPNIPINNYGSISLLFSDRGRTIQWRPYLFNQEEVVNFSGSIRISLGSYSKTYNVNGARGVLDYDKIPRGWYNIEAFGYATDASQKTYKIGGGAIGVVY